MKKMKIDWIGTSRSGNHYFGFDTEQDGFMFRKFVQVTEDKSKEHAIGDEIEIPSAALS